MIRKTFVDVPALLVSDSQMHLMLKVDSSSPPITADDGISITAVTSVA